MRLALLCIALLLWCVTTFAQECFRTSVTAPSPLMGNHGEVFRTTEGAVFQVVGSYEYLYEYYPLVVICPSLGKMLVAGKTVGIMPVPTSGGNDASSKRKDGKKTDGIAANSAGAQIAVVMRVRSCDYFLADGPQGFYVLEWYGGYDPNRGDGILGDISSYGMKDVIYSGGQEGKVYVEDYLLSKSRALEKLQQKCDR